MNFKTALEKLQDENFRKNLLKKGTKAGYYFAGIIAVAAIFVIIDLHSDERTYPKSWVGPVQVGYLTPSEAKAKLEDRLQQYLNTPTLFTLEEKKVEVTPAELGIQFNSNAVMSLPLFEFSRSVPGRFISFLWEKHTAPLQFAIDGDRVVKVLESKFELGERRAHNAKLILDKKKLAVKPEKSGLMLDRTSLLSALEKSIVRLEAEPVSLQLVSEEPSILAADIMPRLDQFASQMKRPLDLWHGGKKWKFDTTAHLEALRLEEAQMVQFKNIPLPDGSYFSLPVVVPEASVEAETESYALAKSTRLALDPDVLTPFLEEKIITSINRSPSDVKMYRDEKEKIVIEGKGLSGLTVSPVRLVNSMAIALNTGAEEVQIPVYETPAKYDISKDLQDLGVRELISVGHSSFHGSPPNRVYNIRFGMEKYNGVLIKPGETFSFNSYLGQVDGRSGFLPEKVIKQNRIEYEYGGGICQVSTTAYRAALLGGLKIDYRAPHSIKVAYYAQVLGHGLDATIYPGTHDLKFTNDTPGAIVMQAYEDQGNAYFKFYGTSDGRTVKLDGPHGGGLKYQWYRYLTKNGEETKETIVSNYKVLAPPAPPADAPAPVAGGTPATAGGSPSTI